MGAGLRPTAKAGDTPPDPTVGAPALYPDRRHAGSRLRLRAAPASRRGRAAPRPPAADRYRVLWDVFVDGRPARAGLAPAMVREERLAEFARAFPNMGDLTEAAFERFFGAARCTHADLAAFATALEEARSALIVLLGTDACGALPRSRMTQIFSATVSKK